MDISSFMSTFLSYLSFLVGYCFDLLDSIVFSGISLLDFCISIMLISAALPIILTLLRNRSSSKDSRIDRKESRSDEETT